MQETIRGSIMKKITKVLSGTTAALAVTGIIFTGLTDIKTVSADEQKKPSEAVSDNKKEIAEPGDENELIYGVGSVSKVYVSAALMQLADEGSVDIDAPVTEYIPEFKMADERYKDITVRMLMDHTSGIMGTSRIGTFLSDDNNTYHHDNLLQTLSAQRLKADPGECAVYCNDGFDLLEQVVENVSGMSYTDYLKENIALRTDGTMTGTGLDMFRDDRLVPNYDPSNIRYENEYVMCMGAGGVYSSASDVARFGAAFFENDDRLLSDKSKKEMGKKWTDSPDGHLDKNGLGWDMVSMDKYDKEGVKILEKGGDTLTNHAFLMIAPEKEISVAVLSNGGSSTYNGLMAEAIMDVALNEAGISVTEPKAPVLKAVDMIPPEYDRFEGYYASMNSLSEGATVSRVSFPGHKYMHVEYAGPAKTTVTDYVLTEDGHFAELICEVDDGSGNEQTEDMKIAVNPGVIDFVDDGKGNIYLAFSRMEPVPGLGYNERKSYVGEKLTENPIDNDILNSWEGLCENEYLLYNDISSSKSYDNAIARMYMCKEMPGYIYVSSGDGVRLLKIIDKENAVFFQSVPSSANRDLADLRVIKDKNVIRLSLSTGLEYVSADTAEEFDGKQDIPTMQNNRASWYKISDSAANKTVSTDKSEYGAIYVYNKYGEVVFSTHIMDATSDIPMPKDGFIMFLNK